MTKANKMRAGDGQTVPATTVLAACREMVDAMSTFAVYTELFGERVGTSEEERTVVEDVRESVARLARVVRRLQEVAQGNGAKGEEASGTFLAAPVYEADESESEREPE